VAEGIPDADRGVPGLGERQPEPLVRDPLASGGRLPLFLRELVVRSRDWARLTPVGYFGVQRYWSDYLTTDSLGDATMVYFESLVVARSIDCHDVQ